MAVNQATIAALDPNDIKANAEYLAVLLKEQYPSLDVSYGTVLYQTLLYPAAVLHTVNNTDLTTLDANLTLSDMQANPEAADTAAVDRLASNFLVTRRAATVASGRVTLILSSNDRVSLPTSMVLTSADGSQFNPAGDYVGSLEVVDPLRDVLITETVNGNYSMTVNVVAVNAGTAVVVKGTTFTTTPAIVSMISAYAESDFVAGQDAETNASVLARIGEGLSAKAVTSRASITALVKDIVPETTDVSVIGFGDNEMVRDRGNIFQVSTGGKVDIYTRTAEYPTIATYEINATVVDASQGLMQINFYRSLLDNNGTVVPWWFYGVRSILPVGSTEIGSLQLVSDTRSRDLTLSQDVVPVFADAYGSNYTAYQTVAITFIDPQAVGTTETTIPYAVTIDSMPGINDLQSAVSSRQYRAPGGDFVVRAPMPCYVTAGLTVEYRADKIAAPDATILKTAISDAINQVDFSVPRLDGSVIVNAVNTVLASPDVLVRQPIDLRGWLRRPDGTTTMLYGANLIVPDTYTQSISRRTTAFFSRPDDVSVALTPMVYFKV
jgi:hypothetical protein